MRVFSSLSGVRGKESAMRESVGQQIARWKTLTRQETRIALMVIERGWSAKDISEETGIDNQTARTHLHNIYKKMGVHSALELLTGA